MTDKATSGAADLPEALRPVEPGALIASIQELNAWEARADGELLTQAEGESIILVLHELKRLIALAAGQAVAPAEPLQSFESPRAQTLMRAWQEGWEACRAAEFVGEEAQNDAFNLSATVNQCVVEDMIHSARPAPPAMDGGEDAAWLLRQILAASQDGDSDTRLSAHFVSRIETITKPGGAA